MDTRSHYKRKLFGSFCVYIPTFSFAYSLVGLLIVTIQASAQVLHECSEKGTKICFSHSSQVLVLVGQLLTESMLHKLPVAHPGLLAP